jgi:hypothetical protein
MEINLKKYTNLISKYQDRQFYLQLDEIKYTKDSTKYKAFHITSAHLFENKENCQLEINIDQNKFILSSDNPTNLVKFKAFFKLLLAIYKMNIYHFNFEKEVQFKFNTKEYLINLRQYVKSEIFNELCSNIKKKRDELDLLNKMIRVRISNFLKENGCMDTYKWIFQIVLQIEKGFDDLNLGNQLDYLDSEQLTLNSYSRISLIDKEEFLTKIQKIQEMFMNLCRIYMEVKKSLIEFKTIHNGEFDCKGVIKNDIINRQTNKFIEREEKKNILKISIQREKNAREQLTGSHLILKQENKNLKEKLNNFLYKSSQQLFFCFKCGNILNRREKQSSNCQFSQECKEDSYFYCCKCKLNLCKLCIIELKNASCSKGHLLFKYQGMSNMKCHLCEEVLNEEGYACNLCDISLCHDCFRVYGNFSPSKCNNCKYSLYWKRGNIQSCKICLNFINCNWNCFFCSTSVCNKCIRPLKTHCGALHKLEKLKNDTNSKLNHIISDTPTLCSICYSVIPILSFHCKRCDYSVCELCQEIIYING